jgi:hypothetical protein
MRHLIFADKFQKDILSCYLLGTLAHRALRRDCYASLIANESYSVTV